MVRNVVGRGIGWFETGWVEEIGWFATWWVEGIGTCAPSHPRFHRGLEQPARYARTLSSSTVRAFVGLGVARVVDISIIR